jgi:hypothetical protein
VPKRDLGLRTRHKIGSWADQNNQDLLKQIMSFGIGYPPVGTHKKEEL